MLSTSLDKEEDVVQSGCQKLFEFWHFETKKDLQKSMLDVSIVCHYRSGWVSVSGSKIILWECQMLGMRQSPSKSVLQLISSKEWEKYRNLFLNSMLGRIHRQKRTACHIKRKWMHILLLRTLKIPSIDRCGRSCDDFFESFVHSRWSRPWEISRSLIERQEAIEVGVEQQRINEVYCL